MRMGETGLGTWCRLAATVLVLATGPGCSDLQSNADRVRIGMTVAEADAVLGPGREVTDEELPKVSFDPTVREILGEGVSYRRWSEGRTTAHVALRGGRIIYGPAVSTEPIAFSRVDDEGSRTAP